MKAIEYSLEQFVPGDSVDTILQIKDLYLLREVFTPNRALGFSKHTKRIPNSEVIIEDKFSFYKLTTGGIVLALETITTSNSYYFHMAVEVMPWLGCDVCSCSISTEPLDVSNMREVEPDSTTAKWQSVVAFYLYFRLMHGCFIDSVDQTIPLKFYLDEQGRLFSVDTETPIGGPTRFLIVEHLPGTWFIEKGYTFGYFTHSATPPSENSATILQ